MAASFTAAAAKTTNNYHLNGKWQVFVTDDAETDMVRLSLKPLNGRDTDDQEHLYHIDIRPQDNSLNIVNNIKCICKIPQNQILRVRNSRGSLVPINKNLSKKPNNSKPYLLEVLDIYQNVRPSPKNIEMRQYINTWRTKLQNYQTRIENLEAVVPELKDRQRERVLTEINKIESKLSFISGRIDDAECTKWTGMLNKSPLW